jgi:hypothetical protein
MRPVSTFFLLIIAILRMPSDNKTPTVNAALISFCRFSDPLIAGPLFAVSPSTSDADSGKTVTKSGLLRSFMIQAAAWAFVTAGVLWLQVPRWLDPAAGELAAADLEFDVAEATAPLLPLLLAAPLVWYGGSFRHRKSPRSLAPPRRGSLLQTTLLSLGIGALAVACSASFGRFLDGLPPALHDEYSYLFQARTLLAGRLSFPSFAPMPELFDQMHVLNEGRFASRYYPGTGLWIAPFLKAGNPWWACWFASGLVAAGIVWIGRELSGLAVGAFAGLLCATSPALIVFSNMLLAHLPTLAGLTLFLWAILVCRSRPSCRLAALAGIGLSFAMLCRPMTAAGFALPFGIDWLVRLLRRRSSGDDIAENARESASSTPTIAQTLCLGFPLLIGFGVMLIDNHAITGRFLLSPYQQYNDIYTPRHGYGFGNVDRAQGSSGPKVIENYDRWAKNLTPQLAFENVLARLKASWNETLGWVLLLFATFVLALEGKRLSTSWKLIAASILTLHLAHVPYWFDGIMHWHYVFETAPLWLLLFAEASRRLFAVWESWGASRMKSWWLALVLVCIVRNDLTIEPLWRSLLDHARVQMAFARVRYGRFRTQAARLANDSPIIVFVTPDPDDRHIDYVTNPPSLDGPVLVARVKKGVTDIPQAIALFPDRHPYGYRAATGEWTDLAANPPDR